MYQLPETILEAIERLASPLPLKALREAVGTLTEIYRGERVRPLASREEHIAYLISRLPATYAVNRTVFSQLGALEFGSFLDVGAGPGTALLALGQGVEKATLIERDAHFIRLAIELGVTGSWIEGDATEALKEVAVHDLVSASYMLSEGEVGKVVELMWQKCGSHLVLIETGTPKGYGALMQARDLLIKLGAKLIAPCPHQGACPMPKGDWCHFSVRLARSKLHRQLKEADLGYEDEKYCYLIAAKSGGSGGQSRIVGAPCKRSGHVHLKLCTPEGELLNRTVSRKDKEEYTRAKEANWGDLL